jgi:acid phosphatase
MRCLIVLVSSVLFVGSFAITSTPAVAVSRPVVVIFMENHERSAIEKSAGAVYLKTFEAGGTSFTHYNAVSHPSLPNYLAFASGSTKGKAGTDTITAGEITGENIWSQAQAKGVSWGVYEESMPSACYKGVSSGEYRLRHDPAMPFANIASKPKMCNKVVPYTSFNVNALPSISFVTPNMCDDMHDCSIAIGDAWLAANVPAMLVAGATVVITFDEGSSGMGGGGNVYAAVDGPGIAPSVDTATFSHYSLLAGIEARYGMKKLGAAKTAAVLPLG